MGSYYVYLTMAVIFGHLERNVNVCVLARQKPSELPQSRKICEDHSANSHTVCPRSSYPFYVVSYYIKWVTTSWTDSMTVD